MLDDQTFTQRQIVTKQPGTCLNCHASMHTTYKRLGNGDLFKGFEQVNHMPYADARKLVKHPVACIDCHDPMTMLQARRVPATARVFFHAFLPKSRYSNPRTKTQIL